MDKAEIKAKVNAAYKDAKAYPDFMNHFRPNIQDVIDSVVPPSVTHSVHVYKDLNYLSEISKSRGYKAKGFLNLVVNYIWMIIKAVEEGKDQIEVQVQTDMFNQPPED